MRYQKMNPEVKRVWINELRSGRYKQTAGALRRRGSYCCLGVLCDLSGAGKWQEDCNDKYAYDDAAGFLPSSVEEWAGVPDRSARELAQRNDSGKTFAEIADWIEKHL